MSKELEAKCEKLARRTLENLHDLIYVGDSVLRDAIIAQFQSVLLPMAETLAWISSQQDLFFAECSQAEEIIERTKRALALLDEDGERKATP